MNKRYSIGVAAVGLLALFACGCSMGDAPKGPDTGQVQAEFSKLDPQKQIQQIQYSPMPPAAKEQKIEEIEKKYGIKRGEAPAPMPGGQGAPSGAPAPGGG